jgi:hypothetical protein
MAKLRERVDIITKNFRKASTVTVKKEMLEGKTDPKVIADGGESIYSSPDRERIMKEKYTKMLQ